MTRTSHARLRKIVAPAFSLLAATSLMGSGLTAEAATTGSGTLSQASWHQAMRTLAVPSFGCFSASFPRVAWHRVDCGRQVGTLAFAPSQQMIQAAIRSQHQAVRSVAGHSATSPQSIGDGTDYSAEVSSSSITSSTGSFPRESTGVTETGPNPNSGATQANQFSLQLNSEFFSGSPACQTAENPSQCLGWQQFIYSAGYGIFMQYWLINYNETCPTNWSSDGGGDCYTNSASASVPNLKAGSLSKVTLTGNAETNGKDSVVLYNGAKSISAVGADSVVGLGGRWSEAEFAVVGNGGGSEATFSANTVLQVRTTVNNGQLVAPTCDPQGFTGETNNLGFTTAPRPAEGPQPQIDTEQSAGGSGGTCANKAGSGKSPVTVTSPGRQHSVVAKAVSLHLKGKDYYAGQTLKWSARDLPTGLRISPTGVISGKPTRVGSRSVTVTATDNSGAKASAHFIWVVSRAA